MLKNYKYHLYIKLLVIFVTSNYLYLLKINVNEGITFGTLYIPKYSVNISSFQNQYFRNYMEITIITRSFAFFSSYLLFMCLMVNRQNTSLKQHIQIISVEKSVGSRYTQKNYVNLSSILVEKLLIEKNKIIKIIIK